MATAIDLDAIAANLQSHGFICEQGGHALRVCHNRGTRAGGKPYAVNVFAHDEKATVTGLTIMIEPAEAASSDEVSGIYDQLAQTLRYGQGLLKDRFPDPKSVTAWCEEKGVHNPGRCTSVELLAEEGQAVFSVTTPPNIDQWSLGWSVPAER